jgi:hypothetical protein
MKAFWSDPYLWIHAAGIAAVPLWLLLCLLGLAAGSPILPSWLEILLIAIAGIAPIVWMQWVRPFCIYSLLAVSLKSQNLTADQRRILTLFKTKRNPWLIGLGAGVLFLLLQQIYSGAGIATMITPVPNHGIGLILAIVSFLAANLFLQVPLSVLQVMLVSDAEFTATPPYEVATVSQDFLEVGLKVNKIVPPLSGAVGTIEAV